MDGAPRGTEKVSAELSYLDCAVLLIQRPGNPVTRQGQLVLCGKASDRICPLRCYCADSALCSHIDLQILGTAARVRTPGTKSSPVQPAVVRVSDAVSVARGSHAAVRDPTRVLNADWPTRAWNRPRREHCTSGFLRQSGLVHVIPKSVTPPQIRGQVLQPKNWCSIASLRFWSLIHANVCYCFDSECKRHFP